MMIRDPDLVHYACIAKGTTVLAEFNPKDENLGSLAVQCLEKTPPHHSVFSHTVRSKCYMFVIDDPFVYFGIFDENLENSEGISFLNSVKDAFNGAFKGNNKRLDNLSSHCFQGEFSPVFHHLLSPGLEAVSPASPRMLGRLGSGSDPSCGRTNSSPFNSLKKKRRLFGDFRIGSGGSSTGSEKGRRDVGLREKKVDVGSDYDDGSVDVGVGLSREFTLVMNKGNSGTFSGELLGHHHHHKAKKVWKKQVWVVLSLDLFICCILFVVWLWVCRGFKCIDS